MIKNILISMLIFIIYCSKMDAQSCFTGYEFKTEGTASDNSRTIDIILSWDISKLSGRDNFKMQAEIQPLNNCWQSLNGSLRSEKVTHDLTSKNYKGQMTLRFEDLNSKCLKWRIKITNSMSRCEEYTPWKFESLL